MARTTRYIMDMPWPAALAAALSALLVVGVVGARVVWQPVRLPSGSMQPTLTPGDYLLVDKFAYAGGAVPQRGDIVVFRTDDRVIVKRVAGGPGDVVQMVGGVLHVNGAPLSGPVAEGAPVTQDDPDAEVRELAETPRPGLTHRVWQRGDMPGDETEPYEVPAGNLFMLGDDRDNSSDSRLEHGGFGYVPVREVVGRVSLKFTGGDGVVPVQ